MDTGFQAFAPGPDPEPAPTPAKILIVDDLEPNLRSLEALLRREGAQVLEARSGRDALELLLVHDDVALALVDVQMPELDGFELAELMRGSPEDAGTTFVVTLPRDSAVATATTLARR